eukprot:gene11305-13357_t
MPKESRRHVQRRYAEWAVRVGVNARRPLTDEDVEELLCAIDKNYSNDFGLVKLTDLQLDELLCLDHRGWWRAKSWDPLRDVGIEGRQTLLSYAAWRGRAKIVYALLRAGADPSVRTGTAQTSDVAAPLLRSLPYHETKVWICMELVHMRALAGPALAEAAVLDAVPVSRETSLALWQALPEMEPAGPKEKKRYPFTPRPLHETAARRIYQHRPGRLQQLLGAAAQGEVYRLLELVRAGVDIDAVDEYGHTALLIAAWHGHVHAARLLLANGADPAHVALGRTTPWSAAFAGSHSELLQILLEAGVVPLESPEKAVVHLSLDRGPAELTQLIEEDSPLAGAGSFYIDDGFEECFLNRLDKLAKELPVADNCRQGEGTDCERLYYADVEGWVRIGMAAALRRAGRQVQTWLACWEKLSLPVGACYFSRTIVHMLGGLLSMSPSFYYVGKLYMVGMLLVSKVLYGSHDHTYFLEETLWEVF